MVEVSEDDTFTRADWLLVGAIVVALLVVPTLILVRPPTEVGYRFAFLVVPSIPAIGLGVVAVWSALQSP